MSNIVEGPPATGCREDSERSEDISLFQFIWLEFLRSSSEFIDKFELMVPYFRFCMCGKLGPVTRKNWTFFCGR